MNRTPITEGIKKSPHRLVGGAETKHSLASNPRVVIEHWKRYLGCRRLSFSRRRDPSPTLGSAALAFSDERGVPTKSGCEKISGDSNNLGEMEGSWKPKCLLKRPAHKLTPSQAFTLGSDRGMATWEVPETCKKRLS